MLSNTINGSTVRFANNCEVTDGKMFRKLWKGAKDILKRTHTFYPQNRAAKSIKVLIGERYQNFWNYKYIFVESEVEFERQALQFKNIDALYSFVGSDSLEWDYLNAIEELADMSIDEDVPLYIFSGCDSIGLTKIVRG